MKKRPLIAAFALFLALVLSLGFAVPTLANDEYEQERDFINMDFEWAPPPTPELPDSQAREEVARAISLELVPYFVCSDYTEAVTRAEFCCMVSILYSRVTETMLTERVLFNDTDDYDVQLMGALGVVSGDGKGNFYPDRAITRQEAALMISRLAEAMGRPLPKEPPSFSDNSSISGWAFEAVGQVQAAKIMTETGNNSFSPKAVFTREQSIVAISRMFDRELPIGWAREDVARAISLKLVPVGLRSDYNQAITRAEFCHLAVRFYTNNLGAITERVTFSDCADPNVELMGALGVVSGDGKGRFAPNRDMTRQEAATMIARLLDAMGEKAFGRTLPMQEPTFDDNGSISDWAFEAVGQMQAAGIMGGTGNNRFSPVRPYTREQSIVTVLKLDDLFLNLQWTD